MKMVRPVSRLSRVWVPSGGIAAHTAEDGHAKLIRAGYLRQSQSGIFHMLPLGLRVQEKIERLVAKHMDGTLGASRVSLSSLSSEALWEKSGRLEKVASELFRFPDRRGTQYLLAPTHEEEITSLVAKSVQSYKDLPLRLYQITRKYRDEFRPRHGLLRSREFVMKDLYTFDHGVDAALETYRKVRGAYSDLFAEMKLPVLAARASSGDMGGDLSHEYHLPSLIGDDRVVHCDSCDYVANEEIADTLVSDEVAAGPEIAVWRGITRDRSTLVNVWYPRKTTRPDGQRPRIYADGDVRLSAVKALVPDLDTAVSDAVPLWISAVGGAAQTAIRLVNIIDARLPPSFTLQVSGNLEAPPIWPSELEATQPRLVQDVYGEKNGEGKSENILRIQSGDPCPRCSNGALKVDKAIELGHTFHLGTRYTQPLGAKISTGASSDAIPIQMGCHGIGISRIIAAVAEHMADEKGLNWPVAIAPYSCVIIPGNSSREDDARGLYQEIVDSSRTNGDRLDVVLDDRKASLPWKLTDADLIGFPVMVVLGRDWSSSRRVEVQCRRLGVRDVVPVDVLPEFVDKLHSEL